MAKNINNIHDKYVRESFSDPHRAAASLQTILPNDLKGLLNFTTLEVLQESYVDEALSEYFSDLVFEIQLHSPSDKKIAVSLLFEHKSKPDKNVLMQVGFYLFAHYHKCILEKTPLIPVIPIIYYQGKRKWKVPKLTNLFDKYPLAIQNYMPEINHIFVALHQVPDETLLAMQNTMMAVSMITQKWRHNPIKMASDIIRVFTLFQNEFEDRNFLQQTFVYMLSASDVKPEDVKKIIESIPSTIKEDIMTTYARIAQENIQIGEQIGIQKGEQIGIQKGEQIGIEKKQTEVILKSFDHGIPMLMISEITGLSVDEVREILKKHSRLG